SFPRPSSSASSIGSHVSGISHPPGSRKRRKSTIIADVPSDVLLRRVDDWDDGQVKPQWSLLDRPHPVPTPHTTRRKKNSRFEIPPERTLENIDQLISQSTIEEEIKELKQQKRLLRNRQAALDSRQRKRHRTEELEEQKKQLTSVITDLEEALCNSRAREAELLGDKGELAAAIQQIAQYIDGLHEDKDEPIHANTIEVAELRKSNIILRETMEKIKATVEIVLTSASAS
ncbi:hypothetical protein GB937_008817, partial [Aspergillus fischeri]